MGIPVAARPSGLAGVLSPITRVYEGEAGRALLLALNFFLLFTAYYLIKPVRESLILSLEGGAELKSVAGGVQALIFMGLVPGYAGLAGRFSGRGILVFVYLFLASHLLLFAGLGTTGSAHVAMGFFLWVGMFNLLVVSQTWSLCSDIYSAEQGKRLFPLIALGATSGAIFGSAVVGSFIADRGLFWPMVLAAVLLASCALLVRLATPATSPAVQKLPSSEGTPWKRLTGGFNLVFSNRYLLLVALLILTANLVNTNSEYMLGRLVAEHAREQIRAGLADSAEIGVIIGTFYGRFFFWVNLLVLLMQLLVVSRIVRHLGIRTALLALPVLALLSYSVIVFLPLLPVLKLVKIAENSTDYSLNNTAREILFLPIRRDEKYKAKFAIDTCFWRGGDALSTVAVLVMAGALGLSITAFAGLNIALVCLWIFIVVRVAAHRRRLLPSENDPSG